MHAVIHDWSGGLAGTMLLGTAKAMNEDSVLVVHDMMLPDTGASWRRSTLDMVMLFFSGGMGRTRVQWQIFWCPPVWRFARSGVGLSDRKVTYADYRCILALKLWNVCLAFCCCSPSSTLTLTVQGQCRTC